MQNFYFLMQASFQKISVFVLIDLPIIFPDIYLNRITSLTERRRNLGIAVDQKLENSKTIFKQDLARRDFVY